MVIIAFVIERQHPIGVAERVTTCLGRRKIVELGGRLVLTGKQVPKSLKLVQDN